MWFCRRRPRLSYGWPTYTSIAIRRVYFILGEGNSGPISQPKRLFSLASKSNYKRKSQPKPQNSPGFMLRQDEATSQLYVVSTHRKKKNYPQVWQ